MAHPLLLLAPALLGCADPPKDEPSPDTEAEAACLDEDGDGYGTGDALQACTYAEADCDDDDGDVHPGAAELCDGRDGDCDGLVDDEDPDLVEAAVFHADDDGDGFGDPDETVEACVAPSGFVVDGTDCDDADAAVHPDAQEVCDDLDVDEDCDGLADDADDDVDEASLAAWYADGDGDGFGSSDTHWACDAGSALVADATDCDDGDADVHPDAEEVCEDGTDNDCDGDADEGCVLEALDDAVVHVQGDGGGFGVQLDGGDLTGDGTDDLAVGNYFVGDDYAGAVRVFEGPLAGELEVDDAAGTVWGTAYAGAAGWSLDVIDDVDGDGVHDLLVGAPGSGGSSASIPGYGYLVTASPVGDLELPDDAAAVYVGAVTGANAGFHVADAGDVDDDGVVEILVGAGQAHDLNGSTGQVYLFSPEATGTLDVDVDADTTLYGAEWAGGLSAWSSRGDLSGDGLDDLVLPANTSHTSGVTNGAVFVVSEPGEGVIAVDRDVDVYVSGDPWTGFGHVTEVGDWTGDGYDDLAATQGVIPGVVYVFAGPIIAGTTVHDAVTSVTGLGTYMMDQTGDALASMDLDRDGEADLAIASPHIDVATVGPGAVDVFYAPLTAGSLSLASSDVNVPGTGTDSLGTALRVVGDTTGDGLDELGVSSIYRDGGAGSVWLFQ